MANTLAGINGKVRAAMIEPVTTKLKFVSLGEYGAAKTFKEKTTKILELTAHGLETGQQVFFTKLPNETSGLVTGRLYSVKKVGVNEIELTEHEGGTVLTWVAFGASENLELQRVKECAHIKARVGITLAAVGDGTTEAGSVAVETTAAQTGTEAITAVLYYEKGTIGEGEILGAYALPSKLEESTAATVTVLTTKANNLVAP